MRKRIIAQSQSYASPLLEDGWLNVTDLAEVEITSEDPAHPIESALQPGQASGWRAAAPGKQTIRLLFMRPQQLRRIQLSFVDPDTERTQEYVLRCSSDEGQSFQDVVRQQWNFSPRGATRQIEDHRVDLAGITVLELSIVPDITGKAAFASLAQLRMA